MLVLSRKINESIIIDGGIKVTVVKIDGNKIRLAFEAPPEVSILREELHNVKQGFEAPAPVSEVELVGAL